MTLKKVKVAPEEAKTKCWISATRGAQVWRTQSVALCFSWFLFLPRWLCSVKGGRVSPLLQLDTLCLCELWCKLGPSLGPFGPLSPSPSLALFRPCADGSMSPPCRIGIVWHKSPLECVHSSCVCPLFVWIDKHTHSRGSKRASQVNWISLVLVRPIFKLNFYKMHLSLSLSLSP